MNKIAVDAKIMAGKPVIKGTRIPVYLILNLLANGYDEARITQAYPELKGADIRAALEYAENITKHEEEIIPKIVYA